MEWGAAALDEPGGSETGTTPEKRTATPFIDISPQWRNTGEEGHAGIQVFGFNSLVSLESKKKKNEPSSKTGAKELKDAPVENGPLMKARPGPTFRDCSHSVPQVSTDTGHQCTETPKRPYPSLECSRSFSYPSLLTSNLAVHMRIHTGEKPFSCPDCGRLFAYPSMLVRHRRIHSGDRPYVCGPCGVQFSQRAHLVQHQLLHTGDKPYSCPDCGRCFRQMGALAIHRHRHGGEKPYVCPECGRHFTHPSLLAIHQRTRARKKPHICSDCGRGFAYPSLLTNHQRVHSGENREKE
uniref:C2H2-type domain-containing protein n=1 Tax=Suricata suricatta TaxID=37032 RepID=A0A673U662_SURSU